MSTSSPREAFAPRLQSFMTRYPLGSITTFRNIRFGKCCGNHVNDISPTAAFDRVSLARCSKRLAQIAVENKILELKFKDRDELSDRKGFFADPSNFPLLFSLGTPGCSTRIYGTWQMEAQAEIERQGGTYTKGIHEAIDFWFICKMDPDDERMPWSDFDGVRGLEVTND